jgi:phosphatidylglycerophosphate synthase
MSLRDSPLASGFYVIVDSWLVSPLQRAGVAASQVTLLGMALALLVPFGFWLHPAAGALLMMGSGLADAVDGRLARTLGQVTPWGAFLDSSLDRISDFFFLCGIWVLFWPSPNQRAATAIVWSALLGSQMISYTKARAESLGIACRGGLMERGLRTLYLVAWAWLLALAPAQRAAVLWSGLLLYAALVLITALERARIIRDGFARRDTARDP